MNYKCIVAIKVKKLNQLTAIIRIQNKEKVINLQQNESQFFEIEKLTDEHLVIDFQQYGMLTIHFEHQKEIELSDKFKLEKISGRYYILLLETEKSQLEPNHQCQSPVKHYLQSLKQRTSERKRKQNTQILLSGKKSSQKKSVSPFKEYDSDEEIIIKETKNLQNLLKPIDDKSTRQQNNQYQKQIHDLEVQAKCEQSKLNSQIEQMQQEISSLIKDREIWKSKSNQQTKEIVSLNNQLQGFKLLITQQKDKQSIEIGMQLAISSLENTIKQLESHLNAKDTQIISQQKDIQLLEAQVNYKNHTQTNDFEIEINNLKNQSLKDQNTINELKCQIQELVIDKQENASLKIQIQQLKLEIKSINDKQITSQVKQQLKSYSDVLALNQQLTKQIEVQINEVQVYINMQISELKLQINKSNRNIEHQELSSNKLKFAMTELIDKGGYQPQKGDELDQLLAAYINQQSDKARYGFKRIEQGVQQQITKLDINMAQRRYSQNVSKGESQSDQEVDFQVSRNSYH